MPEVSRSINGSSSGIATSASSPRTWIGATFLALLLGVGWIASVLILQRNSSIAGKIRLSALALRISELEARRSEKDFLIRSLADAAFHESGESEFLDRQSHAVAEMETECRNLKALLTPAAGADVFEVEAQVREYSLEFRNLVELLRHLGFGVLGREGALRASITSLEKDLLECRNPAIARLLLDLQRDSGELLRRRDRPSQELVETILSELKKLAGDTPEPESLASKLKTCGAALAEYSTLLDKSGRNENEGAQRKLRDAVHRIEPQIARVLRSAEKADQRAQTSLTIGFILSGCLMTALFMISVMLAERNRARSRELQLANERMQVDMIARQQMLETLAEKHQQLLQAERLAAIGQTVTGLAHESRNALQRSQACLEMLRHRVNDARGRELIERAQDAQNHLQHLYEEVRGYAAPLHLTRRRCAPAEIVEKAWDSLSMERNGREAALEQSFEGPYPTLEIDGIAIEQVFRNILENSLAACSDPVRISIRWIDASLNGRLCVRATVKDNGPGLSPEARERIFDPFFTTKTRGTGLGMPIARRIVEAHGGEIVVGPQDGGAEIQITLPKE